MDSIPGSGRSLREGNSNPLQGSCLQNPYGHRSLEGCSQRGPKESDTTEWLTLSHFHFFKWRVVLRFYLRTHISVGRQPRAPVTNVYNLHTSHWLTTHTHTLSLAYNTHTLLLAYNTHTFLLAYNTHPHTHTHTHTHPILIQDLLHASTQPISSFVFP